MAASAHSRNTLGARHPLVAHLRAVADRAAELARVAGLYHDLGKFHPEFQAYLDWCDKNPQQPGKARKTRRLRLEGTYPLDPERMCG